MKEPVFWVSDHVRQNIMVQFCKTVCKQRVDSLKTCVLDSKENQLISAMHVDLSAQYL